MSYAAVTMRIIPRVLTGILIATVMHAEPGHAVETPVVNVALNKPITAAITCGTPAETFYGHRQINLLAEDRVISTCDASNDTLSHPPELMVDQDVASDIDNGYTWWQSTSLNRIRDANSDQLDTANGLDAVITVDLTDLHFLQSVTIQMGDAVRPTQIAIQKSLDGQNFVNWAYKVSNIDQCQSSFQVAPSTAVSSLNGVLCTTYSRAQLPRNEVITFELIQVPNLQTWQQTRYVRFQFYNMPQEFGLFANQFHHYTVRNLQVMAPCQCNDHASECVLMPSPSDPTKMVYQCVCGGNTQGMTCNECLPFFNQYPYETGTDGFQCGACNCFDHSAECYYDVNTGNVNGSINANGEMYGGGVCVDCQNNTAGINCHQCEMYYFRPATKQQTDEDACQSCNCHLPGTKEDPNIGLSKGECVANNDTALPLGMLPGDCYCKPTVQGSKCDECKDGYYDLTDANPNGCLSCNCYTPGTANGSNICDKTSSGQCPCKTNTFDRRCDQCQDGFFGLSADNSDGCSACDCDIGGAVTPSCHQVDGQCTCRENIEGRTCDSVTARSYYGTLHEISAEFESIEHPNWEADSDLLPSYRGIGYVTLTGSTSTTATLTVPPSQLSGSFRLILRVANDGPTQVDVTISPVGDTDGVSQQGASVLPLCSSWCSETVNFGGGETIDLGPGEWSVEAQINTQGGARVYFDYVVAIPVEFTDPSAFLGAERATEFTDKCDVITNNMRLNTTEESICLSAVYSLTTYYFNGAKHCNCDLTGSYDNNCDQFSGQCRCKPGVGGRRCDACLPEYYNFRSTGCTACECFTTNKVCDMTTGQCDCPPRTAGRRCDRCTTYAWGLDEVDGCQACNCDQQGSINGQCDLESGECDCYPGVGTTTCSVCEDGFKLLSAQGCEPCGCSTDGSLTSICNKTDGQCFCKENVGGLTCSDCAEGTFYNSATNQAGCLECICMGVTTECSSSRTRSVEYTISTDASSVSNWELFTIADGQASPSSTTPSASVFNGEDFVTVPLTAGEALYWKIPDLSGNLLGIYGTLLTFSLFYELDENAVNPSEIEIRVIMKGMGNSFVRILGTNTANISTEFTIGMTEEWRVDNAQFDPVTRGEFLRTLVNVDMVLVAAQMNSAAHQSSIGRVSYFKATPSSSPFFNPTALLALTVEKCDCGPCYTGSSCEECASGYYRSDTDGHPYFGICIPCECNGHSGECDPITGECLSCQDNTQGLNCEQCAVGYYGNATIGTASDCTQCPCSPPKTVNTTCELIEGVVTCTCTSGHLGPLCDSCADFHYGQPQLPDGFCTACDCTGNSEECDPITGVCLNCRDGTTGDNCERCNEMTYGNASQQNCQPCDCDATGSVDNVCDHETGQCSCKPGVGTRNCGACLENYYGYGSEGCSYCACNEFGSIRTQCDDAGMCDCLAGTTGDKCDQCEAGSFGLPLQVCAVCGCDATGTEGGAGAVCDAVSGQCPCKTGVAGRQCGMCELGYVDLTADGCTKCDKCVETLLNSTFNLEAIWTDLWTMASLVGELQERDAELQRLEPEANRTIQELSNTINSYSDLRNEIQQINQQQYYNDVNNLLTRAFVDATALQLTWVVTDNPPAEPRFNCPLGDNYYLCVVTQGEATLNKTLELVIDSGNHIERISQLQLEAQMILNGAIIANATVLAYIDILTSWDSIANNLYDSAEPRVQVILQKSFNEQQGIIDAELARSLNVSSQTRTLHAGIMQQALECNRLTGLVNSAEGDQANIEQQIADVKQALDDIDVTLMEIDSLLNDTRVLLAYSTNLVNEAEASLQAVAATLTMAQSDILDGDEGFEDADAIRTGTQNGNPLPVVDPELVENPFGINGWIHGEATASNTINTINRNVDVAVPEVEAAERKSAQLETEAEQIQTIFQGVQVDGQTGVEAIQMYQETQTVLAEATSTSQQATTTLAATLNYFEGRTIELIQQEAANSRQSSVELRTQVNGRSTDVQALDDSLTAANQTLMEAEELWLGLAEEQAALEEQGLALNALAEDPQIQPAINQGTTDSNSAITQSSQVIAGIDEVDARLEKDRQDIETIKETVSNATQFNTDLPVTVTNTETELTALEDKVSSLQSVQNETTQLRSDITSKMTALREKLRLVQERITNTKQPVRFSGQSSITVNHQAEEHTTLFNELQLDFKTEQRDGLLFFAENPETNAFFSLEIITSHLVFKFNVRADVVAILSPIEVCCDGEWYRALATRYEDEGQLSVVQLSTGGASVNHNSSVNTYDRYLTFPESGTQLFVGGLPQDYRTAKALSTDYEGCIANVVFDKQELDLWRPDNLEGSTSCCEGPQLPDVPQPEIIPGIKFTGFGYLELKQEGFDIFDQAAVSFKFRTFLQDAVLFLVSRRDLISYLGVYVNNGKVVYEITTSGTAKYTITSEQNYNDAKWYQVTIFFNETQYNLDIYNTSDADTLVESFSQRTYAPLTFANLQYSPHVILGAHISSLPLPQGTQPTQYTHGPNGLPFAGAIDEVMLSNGTMELVPRQLNNETVKQYDRVTFNGVLAEVTAGIGFKGDYAFAKLRVLDQLRLTKSLSFSFKTFEPNGILAYSYDAQSFNKLFYVVLYHGNVFLQYNIGEGRSMPLQTRGLRLNTGQWQAVSIDFSEITASLKVNNLPTIHGNRQIPTGGVPITATNSYLYVGGVPETIPILIGGDFPVRESLNSGIRDFAINGMLLNFNDPSVVTDYLGMDISGIPPEVTALPPAPFPTQPPSGGETPPVMCAPPIPVLYHQSQVKRLGTIPGGYMKYDMDQDMQENFINSFVITMKFRSVSPRGTLFFAADGEASLAEFMVLSMVDGRLTFSIRTNDMFSNVTTMSRYDDGIWHEVVVLRINNFVAILVQETRDYANNAVASNLPSSLAIGTSFYVGGLTDGIIASIRSKNDEHIGYAFQTTDTFDGCVRKLDVSFTDTAGLTLNFDNPDASHGVIQCVQNEVESGASFNGTGSWIQLEDNFEVGDSLEVTIMLHTSDQRSALLFAVSANAMNFFAVDIYEGRVRVAVSHGDQASYIVRSTQMSSLYDICDGRNHQIIVRFQASQLELVVDGKVDDTLFTPGAPVVTTNSPLYIGGVPSPDSVSIGGLSTESFLGCIQSLTIRGVQRYLGDHISSANIITGCPLPHQ